MNTAFLTGIANGFDVALAKAFHENGWKVCAGDAGMGSAARAFAQIVGFDPDNPESIDGACTRLLADPGHIDIYVDTSDYRSPGDGFSLSGDIDYDVMREVYTANVLRPIAAYEGFLPLLRAGETKRLCFVTGAGASNNLCADVSGYSYNMAKAGLHNFLQIVKNRLMPEGFTLRAYDSCRGKLSDELSAAGAFNYFTRRRGVEGGRDDEPKFVMRDAFGRHMSW